MLLLAVNVGPWYSALFVRQDWVTWLRTTLVVGPRLSYFVRPVRRLLGCTNGTVICTEGDVGRLTLSDLGPVSVDEVSD